MGDDGDQLGSPTNYGGIDDEATLNGIAKTNFSPAETLDHIIVAVKHSICLRRAFSLVGVLVIEY